MPQQQNHNTDDAFPFDWQLDPVRWLLSHEAAPFKPAQQPEGEYFYSDPPLFDLLSPMEATVWAWNPLCMALGHYCPPQPRGIILDVPICPHAGPAPRTYLDPIVCYGPSLEGPPEVMNGCPNLWPQPEQPGQEYVSPYGPLAPPPPPPMPFCPEDMRQPGWFLEGLPTCPNAASAPRTMHWSTECYQDPREPPESPVTEGASRPPSPLSILGARRAARMRRHSWS